MNKRLFSLIGLLAIVGGGLWLWIAYQPQRKMDKAFQHIVAHQYPQAEELLQSFFIPIHSSLCRGYLELSRFRFEMAGHHLEMALKDAVSEHPLQLQSEIALAQAMAAFFKGELQDFCAHLQHARTCNTDHLSLSFFEGLECYLKKSYAEALFYWNGEIDSPHSKWLGGTLDILFPSSWRKMHAAHCLMELGDLVGAKELIDQSLLADDEVSKQPLAHLMLGLFYLKEASQAPHEQSGPYYKLAHFNFEKVKYEGKLFFEKDLMISPIEKEVKQLLSLNDDNPWCFDFIQVLHNWKAEESVKRLVECVSQRLYQQKDESCIRFCKMVWEELHGTPFHVLLADKILGKLVQDVKSGEIDDLFSLWAQVEQLSLHLLTDAKQVAALTSDEIFETIRKDNLSLSRTRNFLAFWEKLGRTPYERETLARDLLIYAKTFWHFETQEKKGQNLMEIALLLSNHHPMIEYEISHFLTTLFKEAENSNMIGRLLIVYDAMGYFGMNRQELISRSTLANYIADAEYLYRVNNYIAAKTQAGWVLKLDPQNENALRLAGLASFQLGEFGHALAYLQQIAFHDALSHQALMLSLAFASHPASCP